MDFGSQRLQAALGDELADEVTSSGFKRILAEVAPNGTIVYKELDASAKVIGTINL